MIFKTRHYTQEAAHLSKWMARNDEGGTPTCVCASHTMQRATRAHTGVGGETELDRPLTQQETKKLMLPLLRLRQACCHPQVSCT